MKQNQEKANINKMINKKIKKYYQKIGHAISKKKNLNN